MKNEFSKQDKPFIIDSISGISENEVIIQSLHFWSDYTDLNNNKIDLSAIIGFKIDYRISSWHVIVTTKEKVSDLKHYEYELSHEVYPKMIAEMIADDRIKILQIRNYHNSDVFFQELERVIKKAKELRTKIK